MADRLTPPILSYRDLRRRAGDFLRTHHPAGTIPVPIEEIVEFRYRKRFQRDLDEADRGWLEYQAYAFAGLILVPTESLLAEYQKALRVAGRVGLSLQSVGEVARPYIANWLARRFDVSSQVVEKRLNKDDLWP